MRTMRAIWIRTTFGLLLFNALWAGMAAAQAGQPAQQTSATSHGARDVYGIVALTPHMFFASYIDARSQVAFEYVGFDDNLHVALYDGTRLIHPVPPETTLSALGRLSDDGELAFEVRYLDRPEPTPFLPRRWSAARGLGILPSYDDNFSSFVGGINRRGDIVGYSSTSTESSSFKAVRWTPANRLLSLPSPAGSGESFASGINDTGISVGYAVAPDGAAHAMLWNANNRPTDFGTFGASSAVPRYINNRGEFAGMLNVPGTDFQAFLWTPGRGVARAGANTVVTALNEAGDMVGRIQRPQNDNRAFLYSRTRGLVDLHPGAFYGSEANDVNDSGVVAGLVLTRANDVGIAYRWSRAQGAVDLNTRIVDAPRTLVLRNALAVAPNGDIVAESNAGLMLLRRSGGSDTPVLGPIDFHPSAVNEAAQLTLAFSDRNLEDTHTATIDWGDGAGPQAVPARTRNGKGTVRAQHAYTSRGDYRVIVRVTDSTGKSALQYVVRVLIALGTPNLVGTGVLPSSARSPGGLASPGPLAFRLAATLTPDAAAPFTFQLLGRTTFKGERLETATLDGDRVRLAGTGQLDGRPGYRFAIEATLAGDVANRMAVTITPPAARAAAPGQHYFTDAVLRQGVLRLTR